MTVAPRVDTFVGWGPTRGLRARSSPQGVLPPGGRYPGVDHPTPLERKPQPPAPTLPAFAGMGRFCREVRDVDFTEAQAILATLAALSGERKGNAAFALADLLSRRGLERTCEVLVAWAREA